MTIDACMHGDTYTSNDILQPGFIKTVRFVTVAATVQVDML